MFPQSSTELSSRDLLTAAEGASPLIGPAPRRPPPDAGVLAIVGLIAGLVTWAGSEVLYAASLLRARDQVVALALESQDWERAHAAGRIDEAQLQEELAAIDRRAADNPFLLATEPTLSPAESEFRLRRLRSQVWLWQTWWATVVAVGLGAAVAAAESLAERSWPAAIRTGAVGGAGGLLAGPLYSWAVYDLAARLGLEVNYESLLAISFVGLVGWSLLGVGAMASRRLAVGACGSPLRWLSGGAAAGAVGWLGLELSRGETIGRLLCLVSFGAALGAAAAWARGRAVPASEPGGEPPRGGATEPARQRFDDAAVEGATT